MKLLKLLIAFPESIGNAIINIITKIIAHSSDKPLFLRKKFLIAFSFLILIAPSILFFTLKGRKVKAWYDASWDYRKPISVSYSGTALTDYDVVIELDTATLISAGKMQSDCDDIRLVDSDDITALSYWIEGGCNTATTQIWTQIPSIPDGGKTIYLYYGNASAVNAEQSWTGKFILLYDADCPTGWTTESSATDPYYQRFPYGALTYGTTGGSSSHAHANISDTTGGNSSEKKTFYTAAASSASRTGHSHSFSFTIGTNASVWPPYLDMLYCSKNDLVIPQSFIALFDASVPTGWTRFSLLDGKFPRGSDTYGGTGGATTHSHTHGSDTTSGPSKTNTNILNGSDANVASASHTHSIGTGSTNAANHMPPYLETIYGQADSQTTAPNSSIVLADAVPPLGWSRFSALDSKFPYGALTYGTTGGATTHSHTVSGTTGNSGTVTRAANPNGELTAANHSHNWSATTDSQSNLPPYVETVFIQRDNPAATTSVGAEEANNTKPNTPSLDSPLNGASNVSLTPALKTTATDDDLDYLRYKIELCTDSAMTTNCQTFDQTASQTGWSGQDAEAGTAYASGTQATYTIQTALDETTTYYWRSYAIDPAGTNTWSNTQSSPYSFTTTHSPPPPTQCSIEEARDDSQLTINWTDNSSDEDGYEIEKSVNGGAFSDLVTDLAANTTSYVDTGISQGNTYQYRISAFYSGLINSPWCTTATLNLQSGYFRFENLKLEGLRID